MLLIDASNINSGGGETLLNYLIETLESKEKTYFVICDPRWVNNWIPFDKRVIIKVNLFNRKRLIKKYIKIKRPKTLLCFGNFPPPFKANEGIKTITYIQNNLLISWENSKYLSSFKRFYLILTRLYLHINVQNSDLYCFQNKLTKRGFIKSYGKNTKAKFEVLPFFKVANFSALVPFANREDSFIFVSSDIAHKNHINLFYAWQHNFKLGIKNVLYVTINEQNDTKTVRLYQKLRRESVPIVNLGKISQEEVFSRCQNMKYAIFPSLIETIGLNLIEASYLGCRVLAPNLEYVDEVLTPSLNFDPFNPQDIAQKIRVAINDEIKKPKVKMDNKINEFINLLY